MNSKKGKKKSLLSEDPDACHLCLQSREEEFTLGRMLSSGLIRAHYYCLLFACGLEQKGEDEEGIRGFLEEDIQKEIRRGQKLCCRYCHKKGATSACILANCRVMFHYPCGLQNKALFQFYDKFACYCSKHRPIQEMKRKDIKIANASTTCAICKEDVEEPRPSLGNLFVPCCKKWLHKDCVQRQADSAGCFYFKCPYCNNKDVFMTEMQKFGIYIPEQDASWETEPNAFVELNETYARCDAQPCECPDGNTFDEPYSAWDIVVCRLCAAQGVHVKCGSVGEEDLQTWACMTCKAIEDKLPKREPKPQASDDTTCGNHVGPSSVLRTIFTNNSSEGNTVKRSTSSDNNRPKEKKRKKYRAREKEYPTVSALMTRSECVFDEEDSDDSVICTAFVYAKNRGNVS